MPKPIPKKAAQATSRKTSRKATTSKAIDASITEPEAPAVKRRGRPPKSVEPVEVPEPLGDNLVIKRIPLAQIDVKDKTYQFRAVVRVPDLVKSIRESGQQIPAVVRPHPQPEGGFPYQLISGFRRATALREIGTKTLSAYVRHDLSDDAEAFRASVLENVARKTYSDIDRAYIIRRHRDDGHTGFEVAKLMGLTDRTQRNLLSLLDLPDVVQQAIASEVGSFKTTHALTLRKLKGKYKQLDYAVWVKQINDEDMSISTLIRKVNEAYRAQVVHRVPSIFRSDGTNLETGHVRLRPVKFDLTSMSDADRQTLKQELSTLMARIDATANA
jgi:ParB/RepB/Spo0J family partition protein